MRLVLIAACLALAGCGHSAYGPALIGASTAVLGDINQDILAAYLHVGSKTAPQQQSGATKP